MFRATPRRVARISSAPATAAFAPPATGSKALLKAAQEAECGSPEALSEIVRPLDALAATVNEAAARIYDAVQPVMAFTGTIVVSVNGANGACTRRTASMSGASRSE